MVDVALSWTDKGADIVLDTADLLQANDIQTAILVSLFSDGRASETQALDVDDRRGWWSDFTGNFGSLLWLLDREKLTNRTAQTARDYCAAALAWLIEQGIASDVTVESFIVKPVGLKLRIKVTRGTNKTYDYAWKNVQDINHKFDKTSLQVTFD